MLINSRGFLLGFLAFLDGLLDNRNPGFEKSEEAMSTLLKSFPVSPYSKLNSLE
jgi:hypothetical protein